VNVSEIIGLRLFIGVVYRKSERLMGWNLEQTAFM